MADRRCVSLVLYESQPELVEATRAVVGDSTQIEIRAGGWDELRTATDLDAVLVANIHAHEWYGLPPRYNETAVANVEWTREIIEPAGRSIWARWLVSPPMLPRDSYAEDVQARYRAFWRIILRDVSAIRPTVEGVGRIRLGCYRRMAVWMPLPELVVSAERVQEQLSLLRDLVDQFCHHSQRVEPLDSPC